MISMNAAIDDASSKLEQARDTWDNYIDLSTFDDRKVCIQEVRTLLLTSVLDGSSTVKKEAQALRKQVNYTDGCLELLSLKKSSDYSDKEKCINAARVCFSDVLTDGPQELMESAKELRARVSLEEGRLEFSKLSETHNFDKQMILISNVCTSLTFALQEGTPEIVKEATGLLKMTISEREKLNPSSCIIC